MLKWQGFEIFKIERLIIYAYVIQSFIQLIVSLTPSLLPFILYFNGAQEINESYTKYFAAGVRGVALSSGTGWSLALSYGVVFIIYAKTYLSRTIRVKHVFIGLIIILGIFFAGRTGFVGVLFGALYFFLNPKNKALIKIYFALKILFLIALLCFAVYILFPQVVIHLVNNVFPYAFEPLYKLLKNKSLETASTNRLFEMWQQPISIKEFFIGSGYYFDPLSGSYYKQVDIGIFKNLYYWGIVGYIFIILFQILQLAPIRLYRFENNITTNYLYFLCIFFFLTVMELKSISLGINKTVFSIVILLGYFYNDNFIQKSN